MQAIRRSATHVLQNNIPWHTARLTLLVALIWPDKSLNVELNR